MQKNVLKHSILYRTADAERMSRKWGIVALHHESRLQWQWVSDRMNAQYAIRADCTADTARMTAKLARQLDCDARTHIAFRVAVARTRALLGQTMAPLVALINNLCSLCGVHYDFFSFVSD